MDEFRARFALKYYLLFLKAFKDKNIFTIITKVPLLLLAVCIRGAILKREGSFKCSGQHWTVKSQGIKEP